jgi:hypothetical protein
LQLLCKKINYIKMKKLSREEMKNVQGGKKANFAGCGPACAGTAESNWQGGTCSSSSSPGVGGLPATTTCTCSVSGGSGC